MENFWQRAKNFAEEAAKKSQTLTNSSKFSELVTETAKKSKEIAAEASRTADLIKSAAIKQADQTLTNSTKFSDLVSETAKKSKEIAAEASRTADLIKSAALKQADQLKSLSVSDIIPSQLSSLPVVHFPAPSTCSPSELEKFGLTDDLREFVKGFTSNTFQNFPIQDEQDSSDVSSTSSNVRKDLTEWQEKHATLVLTTVKVISRLRYDLSPRIMKERQFWKIYFTLVSSHVAPYEKKYLEEVNLKAQEQLQHDLGKQTSMVVGTDKAEGNETNLKTRNSSLSSAEQDLDTFLLGDLEDSDGNAGDADHNFDDDFDKIDSSDVEDEKHKPTNGTG